MKRLAGLLVTAIVVLSAMLWPSGGSGAVPSGGRLATVSPDAVPSGGSLCGPVTPTAHPRPVARLRIGVDPGAAGNPVPGGQPPKPTNARKERSALRGLHPHGRHLVVRLNRLFFSGGNRLLHTFARRAASYSRAGFDVEVQLRYHPTTAENGNIAAWTRYVRHATEVLSRNRRLVGLTVTNEVNFTVSPNTSDGSYRDAKQALVRGVEAAYDVLRHHHRQHRVKVGFTFAYRLNPQTDAALFTYFKTDGGPRFRRALGFVGLDDYPGTVYPPTLPPGDTAGHELATALATMRECYLPLGAISRRTPLWVTENGFPSQGSSDARQAAALRSMVAATRRYAGSYHVTDYRWFNLRDNVSDGSGLFDRDGLLRDNYTRKPSYSALRSFIRHHGR